jgi:hypothetical protein
MILSALIMTGVKTTYKMSDVEIYKRAKAMGMDYPDNFKVINNGGSGK